MKPDKPAINPESDDRLDFKEKAKLIAELLYNSIVDEGVVSVYGKWGAGKTTFLNFIKYYLDVLFINELMNAKNEKSIKLKNKIYLEIIKRSPIIINFNPWWFKGQEQLIKRFLDVVLLNLKKDIRINTDIIYNFYRFCELLNGIDNNHTKTFGSLVLQIYKYLNIVEPDSQDLYYSRNKLANLLKELNFKILIFIDDIDRLNKEEINNLFSVIKSVINLPNIIYILSFDKEIVIEALSKECNLCNSENFLDKIVQMPINLPHLNIANYFLEDFKKCLLKLNVPVKETEDDLNEKNISFDMAQWDTVFELGILPLLDTPRKSIKLINIFETYYTQQLIEKGVQPVNYLVSEAIRLFSPITFSLIQQNKDSILASRQIDFISKSDLINYYKNVYYDIFNNSEIVNQKAIGKLVSYLFPSIYDFISNNNSIVPLTKRTRSIMSNFYIHFLTSNRKYQKVNILSDRKSTIGNSLKEIDNDMNKLIKQYDKILFSSRKKYSERFLL